MSRCFTVDGQPLSFNYQSNRRIPALAVTFFVADLVGSDVPMLYFYEGVIVDVLFNYLSYSIKGKYVQSMLILLNKSKNS